VAFLEIYGLPARIAYYTQGRTVSKAILGSTLTSLADGKSSTNARQMEGMFTNLISQLAALNGYGTKTSSSFDDGTKTSSSAGAHTHTVAIESHSHTVAIPVYTHTLPVATGSVGSGSALSVVINPVL
jgi:hypothetical protein